MRKSSTLGGMLLVLSAIALSGCSPSPVVEVPPEAPKNDAAENAPQFAPPPSKAGGQPKRGVAGSQASVSSSAAPATGESVYKGSFAFQGGPILAGAALLTYPSNPAPKPPRINPAGIQGNTRIVTLPAPATHVCLAASGRFMVVALEGMRQVAVIDLEQGEIVRYLPADDDDVVVAGGATKLVVLLKSKGLLSRWDLKTWTREQSIAVPPGEIENVALGIGSEGPLYVAYPNPDGRKRGEPRACEPRFHDLATLQPIAVSSIEVPTSFAFFRNIAASPDGKLFCTWTPGNRFNEVGTHLLRFEDNRLMRTPTRTIGAYFPAFDNSVLVGRGGLLTTGGVPISNWPTADIHQRGMQCLGDQKRMAVPAVDGSYFLSWSIHSHPSKPEVTLHSFDNPAWGVAVPGIRPVDFCFQPDIGFPGLYFVMKSNLVAQLATTKDYVVLHSLKAAEHYAATSQQDLVVTSVPPQAVPVGSESTYQVEARAKSGPVSFANERALNEVSLSKDGALKYRPQANDGPRAFTIGVSDQAGNVLLHSFTIGLTGAMSR